MFNARVLVRSGTKPKARRWPISPLLTSGSHQIRYADAWGRRAARLAGGGLADSRCQGLSKPDLSYDQPDDGQTQDGGPDSEDAANEGVCFHGPTLAPAAPRVLIERNHSAIDRSDEGPYTASPRSVELLENQNAEVDAGGLV